MIKLLQNPIFLIAISIIIGKYLGSKKIKNFSLGASAIMFVGIAIIEILYRTGVKDIEIPSSLFSLSLNVFICSVALVSSKTLVPAFKKYGIRFILLAIIVRSTGALIIWAFLPLFPDFSYQFAGMSVGALTSSPGLGNALELAKTPIDMTAAVSTGYIIGYIPGVSSVIIFGKLASRKFNKNDFKSDFDFPKKENVNEFSIIKFMIVLALGYALGSIKLNFGTGFTFSLGYAGGCLIASLILGGFVKGFDFDETKLGILKEFSICAFLAIIGLKYGHNAIESILHEGFIILPIGILASISALTIGFFVGKHILKIELPLLSGGICGAMTSTPGLASTYESFDDDRVVTGYGATYPFGLISAVLLLRLFIH